MEEDIIKMSKREIERLRIIHRVMDKRLTQVEAAEMMGITDRQVRRIVAKIRKWGDQAIVHGNRGRPSPFKIPKEEEERIISIVAEKYYDYGPTFAAEKLLECEGIKISKEKLRQFMIVHNLWQPNKKKKGRIHKWRERKHHYGEMVQMDGSDHDWLEGRGPKIVLVGYVDDATNHVFGRFYEFEGTFSAMDSLKRYISKYGIPFSLYLDRHSAYKTTRQPNLEEELKGEFAKTQFARALDELGIRLIHALSPQAKGRIERIFRTFQDRLVKEMRLAKVSTLEEANAFLDAYLPKYNARFAKPPLKKGNFHRPVPTNLNWDEIFCIKEYRTITNGYTLRWRNHIFLIKNPSITMKKQRACVIEHFDGRIIIKLNDKILPYQEVTHCELRALAAAKKETQKLIKKARTYYRPPKDHPWRKFVISNRYYQQVRRNLVCT